MTEIIRETHPAMLAGKCVQAGLLSPASMNVCGVLKGRPQVQEHHMAKKCRDTIEWAAILILMTEHSSSQSDYTKTS